MSPETTLPSSPLPEIAALLATAMLRLAAEDQARDTDSPELSESEAQLA